MKPCRMRRFSVRPFVCLLICLPHSLGYPARPEVQPARPEAQSARPEAQLARPNAEPARPEAEAWLEYMVWGMFWSFSGLRGFPRALVGSQLDDLVFLEKSRIKIVLWDGLTMGKLGVSPMEGGQRDI